MDFFETFLVSLAAIVAVVIGVVALACALARRNLFFTIVGSGWCRIVLEWGEYSKTIGPGFHWIGIPGINTLYSRKMTFLKSVTDAKGIAKAEPHDEKDISSFKTTRYPYALPFEKEEDSHMLPLSGLLAVFATVEDYQKAFFVVSDWYAEMNVRILKCLRDLIAEISYDEDIAGRDTPEEQAKKTINERLQEKLNCKQSSGLSILEELRNTAGIRVESVELVSIDPPEDWRATTLAPYKALKEKEAAVHQAEASATLFDDTNQALKAWLEDQRAAGHHPTQGQIEAKQEELRARALAKTGSYQQLHIKGLEGATTAVVGGGGGVGGGAGILVGGGRGQGGNRGRNSGGGGQQGNKTPDQAAQEFFNQRGIWPHWDPQKRQPSV